MAKIPNRHVEIEVVIDENGNFRTDIVGHGAGSNCSDEDDDQLLADLFDDIADIDDWGKTDEHYDEKGHQYTEDGSFGKRQTKKQNEKDLDLGYGV